MPGETATPVRSKRIQLDTLTGVRGVASMIVFITHAGMEPVFRHKEINNGIVWLFGGIGEAAVSFFFMLSGFVLVWASRPGDSRKAFWRRRVVKIYPNHVTTWTVAFILMIVAGELKSGRDVLYTLPSLGLFHVWIPQERVVQGTDGPAWSLACEMFFYALFPLLLVAVNRIRADRLWRYVLGAVGLLFVITLLVGLLVPSQPQALGLPISLYQFYILIFLPPIRLIDFALGMLLARLVITKRWPMDIRWSWIAASLLLGWVLSTVIPRPLGFVAAMILPNLLLVGKAATMDLQERASFFTRRSIVWLGDVSFAFYLVHWLVLHYGRVFLGGGPWSTPVAIAFLVGCLVVGLGLGELLRRNVELPAMKRWARSKRRPPSAPTSTEAPLAVRP